jgi:hypothetical protein
MRRGPPSRGLMKGEPGHADRGQVWTTPPGLGDTSAEND